MLLFRGTPASAYELAWRCHDDGLTSRVGRGEKARSEASLFAELGAAMQFPDYYGENWPATAECLSDLAWLPRRRGYVVIFADARAVLSQEGADALVPLVGALTRAAESWGAPVDDGEWWDRPAVPFHVVLQADDVDVDVVRSRWVIGGPLGML